MSNGSWFFASQGKQQGPYPEAQLHEFIANGTVTAETLVWTEGMAGWQKAGNIPGLLSGTSGPPVVPGAGAVLGSGAPAGGSLSVHFGIWDFIWRTLVLFIGLLLVIPVPWVIVMVLQMDRIVHARSGSAKSHLHGPADHHPMVVLGSDFSIHLSCPDGNPVSQRTHDFRTGRTVLARNQVVRCELRVEWAAAWAWFLRFILGLSGLEHPVCLVHHHHYRLGVGLHGANAMDVPSC